MADQISPSDYHVVQAARKGCNRCGSRNVTWWQNREGRWYLTEVFEDADGNLRSRKNDFHSRYCGNSKLHDDEQERLSEWFADLDYDAPKPEPKRRPRPQKKVKRAERIEQGNISNAEYFLRLHDLCKSDPAAARGQIAHRREMLESATGELHDRLTGEINFMQAALGELTYDD